MKRVVLSLWLVAWVMLCAPVWAEPAEEIGEAPAKQGVSESDADNVAKDEEPAAAPEAASPQKEDAPKEEIKEKAAEPEHEEPKAQSPEEEASGAKTRENLLNQAAKHEILYANPGAKVRVVEYASLSCSHCKDFYENVFVKLKEQYIDTGKVEFVYRHYPLNAPAFRAAMLVQCVEKPERQKVFLSALFKAQNEWAYQKSEVEMMEKLSTIAKIGGIDDAAFTQCMGNKELEQEVLAEQLKAVQHLKIQGTPALFVNGEMLPPEAKTVEAITQKIDALLSE